MNTYGLKMDMFRRLHQTQSTFVLPNAWDVISAKIFEESGFKAIGTTSAGIAASLGYQDGQHIPIDRMVAVIESIVQHVNIPVSADIEAGYGKTVAEVVETVEKIINTGAVGINIEDGTGDPDVPLYAISSQVEKISAIKELSKTTGNPLFINARTDSYWLEIGHLSSRFQKTIERVKAYQEAGADCIFVPGLFDKDKIQKLRQEISCPINLIVSPQMPSLSELSNIGIERLSTGSAPFRATVSLLKKISEEINDHQTFDQVIDGVLPYGEVAAYSGK